MGKVTTLEEATEISKKLRSQGKTIVLVGGCFDILHGGHLTFLENAKAQGDVLLVALESDENVRRLKGKNRPINNQQNRATNLASLDVVDFVILLPRLISNKGYFAMTKKISPDIIAITEGDPKQTEKEIQAKAVGGKVVVAIKYLANYSTTRIEQKL